MCSSDLSERSYPLTALALGREGAHLPLSKGDEGNLSSNKDRAEADKEEDDEDVEG